MNETFEIQKGELDALVRLVARWGATVTEDWNEPEGARFIGVFEGRHITLFPKYDRHFAMYFTVAHLYGHMVQNTRPTADVERAIALIGKCGQTLTHDEIQCIYRQEIEAAELGRRLMEELGPIPRTLDEQYSRMFLADFHYLIHFIETGESGAAAFARFLRREPVPFRLIEADRRPLVDLSQHDIRSGHATVV